MSHSAGDLRASSRPASPGSLKRKRDIREAGSRAMIPTSTSLSNGVAPSMNGHRHSMAASNGVRAHQYTSPDSDEMQTDQGDMLHGVGSASSRGSAASSVFTHTSHAFAHNSKASTGNGLTPLTNHTDSSPPKGNSPRYSKTAADMASIDGAITTTLVPTSDITPQPPQERAQRPQMLPLPGTVKGYRAVWDPELDGKLSKEERKRATFRKRDFGAEVRFIFHILLSLRNMIHIT